MFTGAKAYERFMGRWSRLLAQHFVAFAKLDKAGRVLDVGSGTGNLARAVVDASVDAEVTGIDPSTAFVDYASSLQLNRVRFCVGDAQALPFEAGAFDACCALLVLNFIPDQQKALMEMRRVTHPGGTIAAAVWDHADGMHMLRIFWEAADAVDPSEREIEEPQPLLKRDELVALWTGAQLRDVEHQALTFDMRFASFADYWEPFQYGQGPAGAYLQGVSPHTRAAIERELRVRLLAGGEDRPFTLSARAWAVRGTR